LKPTTIAYPIACLYTSPITGNLRGVHHCGECGALVAAEARDRHTWWHHRLDCHD
jgi:hypothetical protein